MALTKTLTDSAQCDGCQLQNRDLCRGIRSLACVAGQRGAPRLRLVLAQAGLANENDTPKFSGILRKGYLRTERILADGRRSIIGFFAPGDLVGDVLGSVRGPAIVAATDAEICCFDTAALRLAMREDPALNAQFIREAMRQHTRQLEMVWRRGALNSRERIVAFMVMATEFMPTDRQADGGLDLDMQISRRDWADFCNTTVETISRTLTYLAEKHLVESLGDGCYRIRDLGVLSLIAGLDHREDHSAMLVDNAEERRVRAGDRSRGRCRPAPKPARAQIGRKA